MKADMVSGGRLVAVTVVVVDTVPAIRSAQWFGGLVAEIDTFGAEVVDWRRDPSVGQKLLK